MRFLVDENLSPLVARLLSDAGVDAAHVLDCGLGGASDAELSAIAVTEGRTIISADSDFAAMLALSQNVAPSLVLLRSGDHLRPHQQAELLLANLPSLADDLAEGVVVSLGPMGMRVRPLPLR
ncbi:MAG: DUF5615 family PIN-like protein [Bifidobacteriaceae bacterium]|jgi:predicted nuclease of predicted toxin-antitoxin system|nr:DUF5615 family PIN-like protein [Bifidobacteriaceae bacterium]